MSPAKLSIWKLVKPRQAELLRQVAKPVTWAEIESTDFQKLIDQMISSMYRAGGIGLAAPQIGISIRLAVIVAEVADRPESLIMINPVITDVDRVQDVIEEGCLSIPGKYAPVTRSLAVRLKALDRHGQPYQILAKDLLARVIQHEVDHLNGRLFIDRLDQNTRQNLNL